MAGQASSDGAPVAPAASAPVSEAPKKTDDELKAEAEAEATKAKAALRLFKVTADRKLRVPAPVLELHAGANHFELANADDSKPLLTRLAELVATGDIKVELLDGDGKASAWPAATDKPAKT